MSPEERSAIQHVGRVALENFISLSIHILLYGIYLALFTLSMSVTLRRGVQAGPGRVTLYISLTSFLLLGLHSSCLLFFNITQLKETIAEAALDFAAVNKRTMIPETINSFAHVSLFINSDVVVIWRAWVLFSGQRWMMLIPLVLLLGTIGTGVAYFALLMAVTFNYDQWILLVHDTGISFKLVSQMQAATWVLSFAANTVATLLVMYRLWAFNKLVHIPRRRRRVSHVHKVLSVLIESGLIYSLIQLVNVVMYFLDQRASSTLASIASVVFIVYLDFTAMYPCLIVVLVHQRRSMVETFGICTINQNTPDAHVEDATKALEPVNITVAPPNM